MPSAADNKNEKLSKIAFRVVVLLLSVLILPFGIIVVISKFGTWPEGFDSTSKAGIGAIFLGIWCLIMTIRGR